MTKQFSMELAGRTLMVEVGRVAAQANGAAFMHYGDTVVLSTATASEKPRDGIDFFPFVSRIGTICISIPPASVVFLPTSGCLCLPWNVDSIRIHIINATVNPFI